MNIKDTLKEQLADLVRIAEAMPKDADQKQVIVNLLEAAYHRGEKEGLKRAQELAVKAIREM